MDNLNLINIGTPVLGVGVGLIAVVIYGALLPGPAVHPSSISFLGILGIVPISPEQAQYYLSLPNLGGFSCIVKIIPTSDWWNPGGLAFCPIISSTYSNLAIGLNHFPLTSSFTLTGLITPFVITSFAHTLMRVGYLEVPRNRQGYYMITALRCYIGAHVSYAANPQGDFLIFLQNALGIERIRQIIHLGVFNLANWIEMGHPLQANARVLYLGLVINFDQMCLHVIDGFIQQMEGENPLFRGSNSTLAYALNQ